MSSRFSAVAFDLDGTLYPNYSLNVRLLPFLLRHWPLVLSLSHSRNTIRTEQKQSPSEALPHYYDYQAQLAAKPFRAKPEQVKEKIERLIYRGWEPLFLKINVFPHVKKILADLKAAGLKLGLLSDFPPETKLKNLGIADCWDTVLCTETIGALKPAIRPFTELADALGVPPEQILYVGNSRPYDIAGAGRAGMKTALFTHRLNCHKWLKTGPRADFIFHDYRQLRDFVLE